MIQNSRIISLPLKDATASIEAGTPMGIEVLNGETVVAVLSATNAFVGFMVAPFYATAVASLQKAYVGIGINGEADVLALTAVVSGTKFAVAVGGIETAGADNATGLVIEGALADKYARVIF